MENQQDKSIVIFNNCKNTDDKSLVFDDAAAKIDIGVCSFKENLGKIKTLRSEKGKSLIAAYDDYVVVDLETTGLDPKNDSIIEIGAIRVENGIEVSRFQTLINPGFNIDPFITELTGISNQMLSDAPGISNVLPLFLRFLGDNLIVGHNVDFDINFLYDNCMHILKQPLQNDFVDTMRLSRLIYKEFPNHKLQTLISKLSIGETIEHRALSDANMTGRCYEHLKERLKDPSFELSSIHYDTFVKAKSIASTKNDFDEENPLYGKLIIFTGILEKMQRKEAMLLVVNLGGFCGDTVTVNTNFLVLGNNDYCSTIKDGKSNKQKRAEKLKSMNYDIEILSENVFYDMIADSWADKNE